MSKEIRVRGGRKFASKPRTLYITDEQYAAIFAEAIPALQVAMEISYLCAARQGDILSMTWSAVMDTGIYIEQNKTGTKK